MISLTYPSIYIAGFICAILVFITHAFGIKLLYHTKTKVPNQRLILMGFSSFSLLVVTMKVIRCIYYFIYKNDEEKTKRSFLYTNGIFIGLGLCYTLILFLLTLDRLIATLMPLKYLTHFSVDVCKICLTLTFIMPSLLALGFTFLGRTIQVYGYQITLAIITLLSLFMLITYFVIFYKIKQKKIQHRFNKTLYDKNSKRKIIVPFLINLVVIFFHVIPHILAMKYHKQLNHFQLAGIILLITSFGLLLDAAIYIFLLRNIQRTLRRDLSKVQETMKRTSGTIRRTLLNYTTYQSVLTRRVWLSPGMHETNFITSILSRYIALFKRI